MWCTHSSILAWRIPWTEEPGGLQSIQSQRVRHLPSLLGMTKWTLFTFLFCSLGAYNPPFLSPVTGHFCLPCLLLCWSISQALVCGTLMRPEPHRKLFWQSISVDFIVFVLLGVHPLPAPGRSSIYLISLILQSYPDSLGQFNEDYIVPGKVSPNNLSRGPSTAHEPSYPSPPICHVFPSFPHFPELWAPPSAHALRGWDAAASSLIIPMISAEPQSFTHPDSHPQLILPSFEFCFQAFPLD